MNSPKVLFSAFVVYSAILLVVLLVLLVESRELWVRNGFAIDNVFSPVPI